MGTYFTAVEISNPSGLQIRRNITDQLSAVSIDVYYYMLSAYKHGCGKSVCNSRKVCQSISDNSTKNSGICIKSMPLQVAYKNRTPSMLHVQCLIPCNNLVREFNANARKLTKDVHVYGDLPTPQQAQVF